LFFQPAPTAIKNAASQPSETNNRRYLCMLRTSSSERYRRGIGCPADALKGSRL
jgi:hypothetical protein